MKLNSKQQLWASVFSCAIRRSDVYFKDNDLDRHAREHSTAMLAIQLGQGFWRKLL